MKQMFEQLLAKAELLCMYASYDSLCGIMVLCDSVVWLAIMTHYCQRAVTCIQMTIYVSPLFYES